jgi:hypothetical protein
VCILALHQSSSPSTSSPLLVRRNSAPTPPTLSSTRTAGTPRNQRKKEGLRNRSRNRSDLSRQHYPIMPAPYFILIFFRRSLLCFSNFCRRTYCFDCYTRYKTVAGDEFATPAPTIDIVHLSILAGKKQTVTPPDSRRRVPPPRDMLRTSRTSRAGSIVHYGALLVLVTRSWMGHMTP